MEKQFELRLEPYDIKGPSISGIEGLIRINVNGIEIFENKEGKGIRELLLFPLRWFFKNFPYYNIEGMPKNLTPALLLYDEIHTISNGYYKTISRPDGSVMGYAFPKEGKEDFAEWIRTHTFNYGYTEHPLIFQRRNNLMEISWRMPLSYKNPNGCEYISIDHFKEEVLRSCIQNLELIKNSKKIKDFSVWKPELELSAI